MKSVIIISIMLISYAESPAQIDTSYFPRYLEQVIEDNSDENIKSQFYDQIEFLLENPIEINNASEEELLKIPFLDRADAAAIIKYRDEQGRIDSADQMRKIEGIEAETINRIIPFILINKNKEAEKSEGLLPRSLPVRLSLRSRLIRDLKQNLGFQSGKYVGSDLKLYNRITISSNDKVRIGLITEKDPGEKSPADFYSCHLLLRDLGPVKTLLVGDYTFEFGQGLALWGTSSLYKGNETTGLLPRNAHSIVPYLSTNENVVLRGMAIQFSYLHFNVYSFFSYKYLDGSVDTAGNTIGSLDQDGYHRDSSEIARKHTIGEKLMGLAFDYGYKSIFNAGLIYFSTSYSSRFNKRTSFDPSGNKFDFISANYNLLMGRLILSGETAGSNNSYSSINSLRINTGKNLALLFSLRNYSPGYWNPHADGAGEKDGTQDERGFYTGFHLYSSIGILDFYYDIFHFSVTSATCPFPSGGSDFLFTYSIKPSLKTEIRFRYKNKSKENPVQLNNQTVLIKETTEDLRTDFIFDAGLFVELHSRIEWLKTHATAAAPGENGFLIYQDLRYRVLNLIDLSARIILFKTSSYNSRVYQLEKDPAGLITNPPLSGEGTRWYILVNSDLSSNVSCSLKYAETFMPDVKSIGTGNGIIEGNLSNRLSFQIDVHF